MATWIVGGIVLVVVAAVIWKMVSDKRQGKGSCSGDCSQCSKGCH